MPNQAPFTENSSSSSIPINWISLILASSQELKTQEVVPKENSSNKYCPPLQRPHAIKRRLRKGKLSSKLAPFDTRKTKLCPLEVNFCRSCGTTETPEWRKGPDGQKSLCNACGLHFANNMKREKEIPFTQTRSSISSLLNPE